MKCAAGDFPSQHESFTFYVSRIVGLKLDKKISSFKAISEDENYSENLMQEKERLKGP